MNLLIVSHTEHYFDGKEVCGWGPTIREIDHLSTLFDGVVHIAPVRPVPAPSSALPYTRGRVRVRPVSPSGGETVRSKFNIVLCIPQYTKAILEELRSCDVVHVRCPANISLIALLLLIAVKNPHVRWVKYAGNWQPDGDEPWSYKLQRWLLRRGLHRGFVTVNGHWSQQRRSIRSFNNPCLNAEEIAEGENAAATKQMNLPVRLLFVGHVSSNKGIGRILEVVRCLNERGVAYVLDIVGDGADRVRYEYIAEQLGLKHLIRFHGWLSRSALGSLYSQAHLILLPSDSEGWPKVLSEAMAYGVVPIASAVSNIAQTLSAISCGRTFSKTDIHGFADAVQYYCENENTWRLESQNGVSAAHQFSYDTYIDEVHRMLCSQS